MTQTFLHFTIQLLGDLRMTFKPINPLPALMTGSIENRAMGQTFSQLSTRSIAIETRVMGQTFSQLSTRLIAIVPHDL